MDKWVNKLSKQQKMDIQHFSLDKTYVCMPRMLQILDVDLKSSERYLGSIKHLNTILLLFATEYDDSNIVSNGIGLFTKSFLDHNNIYEKIIREEKLRRILG